MAYIFEASHSTVVTSVIKKSNVDQSELKKEVVSHCQTYYMQEYFFDLFINIISSICKGMKNGRKVSTCFNISTAKELLNFNFQLL